MKKTFSFTARNKAPARQMEAIKFEVKKYIAREKRKTTPEGVDFWEFDCRFGFTEDEAEVIKFVDIRACISKAFDEGKDSFYLEILAKAGHKPVKKKVEATEENKNEKKNED
jgi:hypothetical protein